MHKVLKIIKMLAEMNRKNKIKSMNNNKRKSVHQYIIIFHNQRQIINIRIAMHLLEIIKSMILYLANFIILKYMQKGLQKKRMNANLITVHLYLLMNKEWLH